MKENLGVSESDGMRENDGVSDNNGVSETDEQASSVGQTAGLPGQNADPRTERITEDDKADTVSMRESVTGGAEEPEGDAGNNG
jgi:hypothetical protein